MNAPATRKQAQRERDATAISEKPISELPARCLLLILGSDSHKGLQIYAWEEIGRRRGFT